MNEDLKEFVSLIAGANRIALFTGAGISTESGIPDFRSPGGIWTKQAPIDFSDFMRSENARREDLAPAFRHGADSSTGSAEPRSSGGGGIGSVRQGQGRHYAEYRRTASGFWYSRR